MVECYRSTNQESQPLLSNVTKVLSCDRMDPEDEDTISFRNFGILLQDQAYTVSKYRGLYFENSVRLKPESNIIKTNVYS